MSKLSPIRDSRGKGELVTPLTEGGGRFCSEVLEKIGI